MRKTTSLAGALLLCACNASPKPDGPVLAKAGLWRIEGTVISMEGLPPGEPKPADLGHTKTSDKCFKGGKMPDAIWADGDNPPSDVKIEGNHFTAQSSGVETDEPTNQQIGMTLHIEGTFDPNSLRCDRDDDRRFRCESASRHHKVTHGSPLRRPVPA